MAGCGIFGIIQLTMKRKITTICAAAFAIAAFGEYSYENDGKTYVATVAVGAVETLASDDAAATVLNGNNVTNFVKRGGGTLKVSADLSSFTGDLYVEDGVYASSPQTSNAANTTAGATGTEYKIFVRDGATFDFDTAASGHYLSREWHLRGHGYDDPSNGKLGAIHSTASGGALSAVKGKVILEGETMMRFSGGSNVAFVGCPMDMRQNTLVLKSDYSRVGPIVDCNNEGKDFKVNAGDVIVEGCANLSSYLSWLYSSPAGTHSLIVNTNSTLLLNSTTSLDAECTVTHGLVLRKGAKIELVGGGGKYFRGPITFEDPVRNIITSRASSGSRYSITFYGNNSTVVGGSSAGNEIRGSGFRVEGNTMVQVYHPGSGTFPIRNLTTNGMVVANGGVFDISGRGLDIVRAFNLNSDGGDIEVSGGIVAIDNHCYEFAKWGKVLRFSGENCVWAGYPFYNYGSASTTVPSSTSGNRNSHMFKTLDFADNPSIAFSTNVVVLTLNGAGSVSNTVDKTKFYGYTGSGVKCCAFKVHTAWNLDVADVQSGAVLATDGKLDFSSGVTISLTGTGKIAKPYERVIAYAEQGISWGGTKTFEVEDSESWGLSVGDDGKTLLAVYKPKGMYLIFH